MNMMEKRIQNYGNKQREAMVAIDGEWRSSDDVLEAIGEDLSFTHYDEQCICDHCVEHRRKRDEKQQQLRDPLRAAIEEEVARHV